jgi:hypothetical protein
MRKHIFETSNIFLYKKNVQNMLEYWPYAAHNKTFFYIFLSKRKHHEKYSPILKFARSLKQLISNKQGSAHQFKTQVSVHKTYKKTKS